MVHRWTCASVFYVGSNQTRARYTPSTVLLGQLELITPVVSGGSREWCWEKRFPLAHFADKSAFFLCLPCPVPVMREAVGKSVAQWRCAPRWAVRTQTYPWAPSQSQTQSQTSHKPSHKPVTNSVTKAVIYLSVSVTLK